MATCCRSDWAYLAMPMELSRRRKAYAKLYRRLGTDTQQEVFRTSRPSFVAGSLMVIRSSGESTGAISILRAFPIGVLSQVYGDVQPSMG